MNRVFCLLILLTIANVVYAENMCVRKELGPGMDDLRIAEEEFTRARYQQSLEYLKSFPRTVIFSENVEREVKSTETWIGYMTSTRIIEGYVLRTEALASGSSEDIAKFCNFLEERGKHAD